MIQKIGVVPWNFEKNPPRPAVAGREKLPGVVVPRPGRVLLLRINPLSDPAGSLRPAGRRRVHRATLAGPV